MVNTRSGPTCLNEEPAVVVVLAHVIETGDMPIVLMPPRRSLVSREVEIELANARAQHPGLFNSAHEGFAVLKEEVDELWEEIKDRNRDMAAMRAEAIQVAAMAIRFVEDVCDKPDADATRVMQLGPKPTQPSPYSLGRALYSRQVTP